MGGGRLFLYIGSEHRFVGFRVLSFFFHAAHGLFYYDMTGRRMKLLGLGEDASF